MITSVLKAEKEAEAWNAAVGYGVDPAASELKGKEPQAAEHSHT